MKLASVLKIVLFIELFLQGVVYGDNRYDSLRQAASHNYDLKACELLVEHALSMSNFTHKAEAYFFLAYSAKKNGMYFLALNSYFSALDYYRKLGDDTKEAQVIENIGVIYRVGGNYEKAIEYYTDALNIKLREYDSTGIARSYYNIGRVFRFSGQFNLAIEYLHKSYDIYLSSGNSRKISYTANEIGIAHKLNGNYDSAEFYYSKVNECLDPRKDIWEYQTSMVYNNMASMLIDKENYHDAECYARYALNSNLKIKSSLKSLLYFNLGRIYEESGKIDSVIHNYELSIEGQQVSYEDQIKLFTKLAELYKQKDDVVNSVKYYTKVAEIAAEQASLQTKLNDLNIKYQIEAATYKKQVELSAAIQLKKKYYNIGWSIFSSLLLAGLLFIGFKRGKKRKLEREKDEEKKRYEAQRFIKDMVN